MAKDNGKSKAEQTVEAAQLTIEKTSDAAGEMPKEPKASKKSRGTSKAQASKSAPKKSSSAKTAKGASGAKKSASGSTRAKSASSSQGKKKTAGSASKARSSASKSDVSELLVSDSVVFSAPELDEANAAEIESAAIAALPKAEVEIELLLCDNGEVEDTHESPEEAARYEDYLRDYKEIMSEMLRNAKSAEEASSTEKIADPSENSNETADAVVPEEQSSDEQILSVDTKEESDESEQTLTADSSESEADNNASIDTESEADDNASVDTESEADDNASVDAESEADDDACGEANGEDGLYFGEISRERRAEGFDPLSTISLREYIPEILGEGEDTQAHEEAQPELSGPEAFEPEEEYEELDYCDDEFTEETDEAFEEEYSEESEEYGEPEQLSMSFSGEEHRKEKPDKHKYDPKKPRSIDSLFDLIELFVLTFAAIMVITTFFFRHSVIDGGSMEKTLYDGDVVIISNFLYSPERGDIVVLDDRDAHEGALVKRVIGIEGDTVSVRLDGSIYVNGVLLVEDYVFETNPSHLYNERTWDIGEGEIFVLGDHRDVSDDSENFGPVKADSVLGKVLFRLYPFSSFGSVK